jgi:hypothetical protein
MRAALASHFYRRLSCLFFADATAWVSGFTMRERCLYLVYQMSDRLFTNVPVFDLMRFEFAAKINFVYNYHFTASLFFELKTYKLSRLF